MSATMAKKKPKSEKPKPVRTGLPLHVWLEPHLRAAIEEARRINRRSLREEVSIALERYVKELGLWSPPVEKGGD